MKKFCTVMLASMLAGCGDGTPDTRASVAQAPVMMEQMSASRSQMAQAPTINGYRDAFSIKTTDGAITVTNKLTGEVIAFKGVTNLKFHDKNVSFDVNGQAGQVYRLYQAAFSRKPDLVGLGYWIMQSENGTSLTDIAGAFLSSAEFKNVYGENVPAASYVDSLYKNVLHRAGEPDGFNWWTEAVSKGADRRSVLISFSESSENQKNLLPDQMNGFDYVPYKPGSPITPQMTSYLNAKNMGLTPQTIPPTGVEKTGITNGYAFADFFQDGKMSMVAFSENGAADNRFGNHTVAGSVFFYQKSGDGRWVDKTNDLLGDRTGCITPRKVIVSDFNNDGKPDVFASCSGVDDQTGVGEQPRILMSQPDGKYANMGLGFNCYCHAAATIDTNSSGYADIVIVDPTIMKQPVYLKNNHDGTFSKDLNRFADDVKPDVYNFSRPIYTVEFIDINNDGKPDLVLAGSEKACCENQPRSAMPTTVYKNDGNNSFTEVLATLPANMDFPIVLDMVYQNKKLLTLRVAYDYNGVAIVKDDKVVFSSKSTFSNGSYWFDWIIPVDDSVKPLNNAYPVAVKF